MGSDMKSLVGDILKSSGFLKAIGEVNKAGAKSVLFGKAVKPVSDEQIKVLRQHGNWSADWKKVLVTKDFNPERLCANQFYGTVVLGNFDGEVEQVPGVKVSAGVYGCAIADSEIGNGALVVHVGLLSNYIVKNGAVVANTKEISAAKGTSFGVGREISIASETGGREVAVYPEITVGVAAKVAGSRGDKSLIQAYNDFVKKYTELAKSAKGIIEEGARVVNTGKIINAYIGAGAVVDNAHTVENAVILSQADEKTKILDGAFVRDSIVQWGASVETMGLSDKSVLCEHSHVERHGKLTDSILGPNSGVAEGECTASLCGPFVGFHHQSLLIAAYWPEGKGNVGYGANVGSNHTGKAPDQEIWPGEGTFFGLGVNIKFPSNFTKAPYSIIATAVNALPQSVEMPFALINTPGESIPGISPAYNEIMPGWVLSDNIFSVKRNEGKYIKRNKAKREKFVFEVFRPDIVDLMIEARRRLQSAEGKARLKSPSGEAVYTDKEIKGVGKNYVYESARKNGVEAYTFYLQYYALAGLKNRVAELLSADTKADARKAVEISGGSERWQHEQKVLVAEFPGEKDVKKLLSLLVEKQKKIAGDVEESKAKDDKRGVRIIPDYADAHSPAKDDGFVKETWKVTQALEAEVKGLLAKLG
ncbi:MAG: DUF4954 family protein [bacterium]